MTTYQQIHDTRACDRCGRPRRTNGKTRRGGNGMCADCYRDGKLYAAADKAKLRDRFLAAYADADAPCKHDPDTWTAPDLQTRRYAVAQCLIGPCPLLQACDAWASAEPAEKYGVFGGRDRSSRKKKT